MPRRLAPPLALALALLTTAACSSAPSAPDTQQAACAREADSDPAVRDLLAKAAGNDQWLWQNGDKLEAARQQATLRCLRARGLAPKGGVERPQS